MKFDDWLKRHPEASRRQAWETARHEALLDARSAVESVAEDSVGQPTPHYRVTVDRCLARIDSIAYPPSLQRARLDTQA